jgi:hypothetical protein
MDRYDDLELYGGGKSNNRGKSNNKDKRKKSSKKSYTPKDSAQDSAPDSTQDMSVLKLLKENRFLHRDLDRLKEELNQEKLKNKKLQQRIDARQI